MLLSINEARPGMLANANALDISRKLLIKPKNRMTEFMEGRTYYLLAASFECSAPVVA